MALPCAMTSTSAKRWIVLLVLVPPLARVFAGGAQEIQQGPAASPLSWQEVVTKGPAVAADFLPRRNDLGLAVQATWIRKAEFLDSRPYGTGTAGRTVWLARYESVLVPAPDGSHSASVPLTFAYDAATEELLCAFTDPAPVWTRSKLTSEQVEALASERCSYSPARYRELQATVSEVLTALWKEARIDPSKTGQIVIRPRYASCTLPAKKVDKQLVPLRPPGNTWIVEILGSADMRFGWCAATLVAEYVDADGEIVGPLFLE